MYNNPRIAVTLQKTKQGTVRERIRKEIRVLAGYSPMRKKKQKGKRKKKGGEGSVAQKRLRSNSHGERLPKGDRARVVEKYKEGRSKQDEKVAPLTACKACDMRLWEMETTW